MSLERTTQESGEQKLSLEPCEKIMSQGLLAHEDYYVDSKTGFMVFTAKYLLGRGYCCSSGCRHCPYSKPGL